MRSAPAAALSILMLALALAARVRGSEGDPESLPMPPGLGHSAIPSGSTLRAALRLPTCPSPIDYAVFPAHDVSVDPSLVAADVDSGRTIVVYGGSNIPDVFTAEIIDALYLARRLARVVGLSQASFGSNFVVRFAIPLDCKGLAAAHIVHALDP